jgi:hypothetical protein
MKLPMMSETADAMIITQMTITQVLLMDLANDSAGIAIAISRATSLMKIKTSRKVPVMMPGATSTQIIADRMSAQKAKIFVKSFLE